MSIVTKKLKFILALVFILGIGAYIFRGVPNNSPVAEAAITDNLSGFAWSENIGWISFNCTNTSCLSSNYGVNMDPGTGNFSGFAWSENIGWISFNAADVAGCPAGICQPHYNSVTNEVTGWARARANGNGWDGWISLNCASSGVCGSSNYKVSRTGNDFTGFAWGGDVVGWVSLNCANSGVCGSSNYKVFLSGNPPVVAALAPSVPSYCAGTPSDIQLSWTFNDFEDGASQTAYRLTVTRNDGVTYDSGKVISGATAQYAGNINGDPKCTPGPSCAGFINYGNYTYNWTITIWDSSDLMGGPIPGAAFGFGTPYFIPPHPYPDVSFTPPSPSLFFANQAIDFDDSSTCYNAGGPVVCQQWVWNFEGAPEPAIINPPNLSGDTTHTFSSNNSYDVRLTVEDPNGNVCTNPVGSKVLKVLLPKWKEVIPQ